LGFVQCCFEKSKFKFSFSLSFSSSFSLSFFTEYLAGATLIKGKTIEASNKNINAFNFLIFNT